MPSVSFSKSAVNDLSDIWRYTANVWSVPQADKYYKMLVDSCYGLLCRKNTLLSRDYGHIKTGLKGIRAGKHIVFYRRYNNGNALIVRILHEAMDAPRHL